MTQPIILALIGLGSLIIDSWVGPVLCVFWLLVAFLSWKELGNGA